MSEIIIALFRTYVNYGTVLRQTMMMLSDLQSGFFQTIILFGKLGNRRSGTMLIREAQSGDIQNIARLYTANWKTTYRGLLPDEYLSRLDILYAADKWSSFLKQPDHRGFVACDGSQFCGFGACSPDHELENCMYLDSLHVSMGAQGKGIGTRLIQRIGRYAAGVGYTRMSVCIVRGNDRARNLYSRLGAVHDSYFVDDFGDARSQSEKLLWMDLKSFQ